MRDRYTRYPRTILWLVPGGELRGVEIAPFYIGKLPITNEQLEAFDPGFERASCSPGDRDPAAGVALVEALDYCAWYAEVSRKPMRLPIEEEWEYACRAGAGGRYPWGDDPAAADLHLWDAANSGGRVPPLEHKKANGFGLYGMLGGVWEWVAGEPGPGILRGGSYLTPREEISCALRRREPAGTRPADAGFRIAKSLR